jgi:hypothetical protein
MVPEYVAQAMLRGVLNRLTIHFGGDKDADDEASESPRFIPSVLDASVRYSHGGSNTEGNREIANIEEEAQKLAEQQRKK